MKHVLFAIFGVLFALSGVLIQKHGLITVPAYWAFYGAVFGLVGSWLLDRRWGEEKEKDAIRESALDVLEKHGLRAHYYLPGSGFTKIESLPTPATIWRRSAISSPTAPGRWWARWPRQGSRLPSWPRSAGHPSGW